MGVVTACLDFFKARMLILEKVLMLAPTYAYTSAIISVGKQNVNRVLCKVACAKNTTCLTQHEGWACEQAPDTCCDTFESRYSFESPGIGLNITMLISVAVLANIFLLLIDFEVFKQWITRVVEMNKNYYEKLLEEGEPEGVDQDVLREKLRVRSMGKDEIENYQLVTKDLSKCYGKLVAVNQLSLSIEK